MTLEDIKPAAIQACRDHGVRRLDVFGSLARGETTSASDVDFLVEFFDPDRNPAKRFFGLLHQLEDRLGRKVDLITTNSLRNPYFKKRVLEERIPLYEG